jgi:hypothetical protein
MRNIDWWRSQVMLDSGYLMLVEDSVFSGDNKGEFFENPVSRNQYPASFCLLFKSDSKT